MKALFQYLIIGIFVAIGITIALPFLLVGFFCYGCYRLFIEMISNRGFEKKKIRNGWQYY
jgi:hypothetical protein